MSIAKVSWPEIMRVWAQWIGIGLAAIPAGLMLGLLLRYGIREQAAIPLALTLGFLLAVTFWMIIGRWISTTPVEYATVISANVISPAPASALATAALVCLTLYSFEPPVVVVGQPPAVSVAPNAIPQI